MLEQQQQTEENKNNLSEGLRELIYKANTFAETAAQIIIQAYRYAIDVDKLQPRDAARILKDNLVYSPQWINKQLPDEAKHIEKRPLTHNNGYVKRVSHNLQENPKEVVNITTKSEIQDAEIIREEEETEPIQTKNNSTKPTTTEAGEKNNIVIMEKKEGLKFANDLRVDILGRLNKNGTIQFQIIDGELTYKFIITQQGNENNK